MVEHIIFVSAILVGSLITIFLIAALLWYCYNKRKTQGRSLTSFGKKIECSKVTWENNSDYECDDGLIKNEKNDQEPVLPDWLKERKEMIFSSDCVEKGKKLGSGQFGAVFKGKFIQGLAVYVKYYFDP